MASTAWRTGTVRPSAWYKSANLSPTDLSPTDAAFDNLFAALNTTGPDLLNASMPLVIDVLKYHVSPDMLDESALAEISTLLPGETLMADEQMVEAACSNATVAAGLFGPGVETCSGMAYVIDHVLLPSSAGCA